VVATLSRDIPRQMKAAHVVGLSIALLDGDRTVWARGFGWADRARQVPVTENTLFHIGSSSKTMTAAAVMQLVEQGRVDLDAPLSRYVPGFRCAGFPGSTITVAARAPGSQTCPTAFTGSYPRYRYLPLSPAAEFPEWSTPLRTATAVMCCCRIWWST
jgi:hypothetical protein